MSTWIGVDDARRKGLVGYVLCKIAAGHMYPDYCKYKSIKRR